MLSCATRLLHQNLMMICLLRIQTLFNQLLDGLRSGHVTQLLQNDRLKDDEMLGAPLPLTTPPQIL